MGHVCNCVLRFCCNFRRIEGSDDEEGSSGNGSSLDLSVPADQQGQLEVDREFGESGIVVRNNTHPGDFWAFLQGFLHGFGNRYQVVSNEEEDSGTFWSSSSWRARAMTINSPLRTASSFDASTRGTPTIEVDEIVLPGSQLQLDMAKQMAAKLESQDDECVICMEGFDDDNPRMPTLCGCGENKTYFHLPCLYQWIDRNQDCPSCRKKLTWEEF